MLHSNKITVLICAFLIKSVFCFGDKKEEYYARLAKAEQDTAKVSALLLLSDYFLNHNPDSALSYAQKALNLSEAAAYEKGKCISNQEIGIVYQNTGEYNKANSYFFKALKSAEKLNNDVFRLRIFNSIANALAYQKSYDQALIYYNKALDLCTPTGNDLKRGVLLMNMGNIAYTKGYETNDFSEALNYFGKALVMAEASHDTDLMASVYGNYALVYTDAGKFEDALKMIDKGMELSRLTGAEEDLIFLNYYAGRAYAQMKKYDLADVYFNKSIEYSTKFHNRDYLSENFLCLADMNYERKSYKEAYDFLAKHFAMEDSLLNDETTQQLNELKTVYETEKKEKEIELSHQKLQSYEAKQSKLMVVIFSIIVGVILLMVLVLVVLSRYRLKQKASKKLETAYAIIEEKQKDITDSINYAQKIQYAILPNNDDIKMAFEDAFVFFKPRDVVSGDFYWFHQIGQGNPDNVKSNDVMIAAADCTGHGVPGAMMSMIGSSLLDQIVLEAKYKKTGDVLDQLRQGIKSAFKQKSGENVRRDGMDIGLLAFKNNRRSIQFSGANNGLYFIRSGELNELKANKQPVGQHEGIEKEFDTIEMDIKKGDCFYLYTDGFADQFGGEKGKKFKYAKLKEILINIHAKPMAEQQAILEKEFASWKGKLEQIDDVLIIGIRV